MHETQSTQSTAALSAHLDGARSEADGCGEHDGRQLDEAHALHGGGVGRPAVRAAAALWLC